MVMEDTPKGIARRHRQIQNKLSRLGLSNLKRLKMIL